jgi:hypothetical protein
MGFGFYKVRIAVFASAVSLVRFLQVFATAIDLGERVSVKGLLHV